MSVTASQAPAARTGVVIVPDTSETRVLLRTRPRGWTLPTVTLPCQAPWWELPSHVLYGVRTTLRLAGFVVRALEPRPRLGMDPAPLCFVVESYDLEWMRPPGTDWFALADLDEIALDDEQRELIQQALAPGAAPPPPPWMRRGFVGSALSWVEAQLQEQRRGCGPVGLEGVEQLRLSSLGCLLRVPLADGHGDVAGAGPRPGSAPHRGPALAAAYLKACGSVGAHEPHVHAWLARHHPALAPRLLAHDEKRGLLLSADGGASGQVDPHQAEWLLRELCEMQIASARMVDELCDMGCPDRSPAALTAALASLPASLLELLQEAGADGAIDAAALDAFVERVRISLAELAHGEVPIALGHPNLSPKTVVSDGADARVTDWRGVIAHPFSTPGPLIDAMPSPAAAQRLCRVYLDGWSAFAPHEHLCELYRHAQVARGLQCILDVTSQLPALQSRTERASALRVLRAIAHRAIATSARPSVEVAAPHDI